MSNRMAERRAEMAEIVANPQIGHTLPKESIYFFNYKFNGLNTI